MVITIMMNDRADHDGDNDDDHNLITTRTHPDVAIMMVMNDDHDNDNSHDDDNHDNHEN